MRLWAIGICFLLSYGLSAVVLAQELFSADVLLERSVVDESGRTVSTATPTRFRLIESIRGGQAVTRLTYVTDSGLVTAGAAADRLAGMSVELDENGRELRVYDRQGRQLDLQQSAVPTSAGPGRPNRSVHGGPIFRNSHAADRLRELQTDLGMPVGKVRELERYVRQTDKDTTEVLVLMPWAVAVEINVVRNGQLESHSTYEYDRSSDDRLLQRVARTETRLPNRPGERAVVQLTFSNVAMAKGR